MTEHIRALIVEDDETDAELVAIHLTRNGFAVDWERVETEAALNAALDEGGWDVVLSDFAMPRYDGLRAFETIEARGLDVPFIFVSGALGEERAVEAMRAGAKDYILKGNLNRLAVAVKRELRSAESRRRHVAAEEAKQRDQRRLAMAVKASGAGIFEFRLPSFTDAYLSDTCIRVLGYQPGGVPLDDRFAAWVVDKIDSRDVRRLRVRFDDFLSGKSARFEAEGRVLHRDGRWVDVRCVAEGAAYDPKGNVSHVVGVILDLTDRKRLEAQFRQAQKMEAIGTLAGGVAHDFNNLLTAIISYACFLEEDLAVGSRQRGDAAEILKCARRASDLTRQLLAFSRQQMVEPRVFDLCEAVRNMTNLLQRLIGEDVRLDVGLPAKSFRVHADPGQFEQVLVNLIVNARDAMPDGGSVSIRVSAGTATASDVVASELESSAYAAVVISDTGVGMSDEVRSKVFEPFFTTKDRSKGTGLGLATAFGIVKQAGGHIEVDSIEGRGSTFTVYLPRTEQAVSVSSVAPSPRKPLKGSETILFVEDDRELAKATARALSASGYRVLVALDPTKALELVAAHASEIDLLFSDVILPSMSGPELYARIRQSGRDLPVLFSTGYASPDHRLSLPEGAPLLLKPYSPTDLSRKIREALGRAGSG